MASDPTDLIREGRAYADALALQQGKFEAADIVNRILDALEASEAEREKANKAAAGAIRMATDRTEERDAALALLDRERAALAEANATIERIRALADTYGYTPNMTSAHHEIADQITRAIEGEQA